MVDEPRATKKAEKKTQQEPVPSSDQKTPEPAKVEEVAPVKEVSEPPVKEEGPELPEGVKERTSEQFEKLKLQTQKEREARIKAEQALQQKATQQPVTEPGLPTWYNEETGNVDVNKLQQEQARKDAELAQLKQQVQGVQQITQAQQEKETFDSYPELNPSGEEFNEDFHDAVTGYLMSQMTKGKTPTFKEAADRVSKFAGNKAEKAEKEGAKKALEQLSPKEQASLEATGRSDRRLPERDIADLQQQTRRGGDKGIKAIVERLKNVPPVGK